MSPASTNRAAEPAAGKVLVVGAGVAGLRAALDLAEEGHLVQLVDAAASPGGLLLGLDQQFPDDHCGLCRLLPDVRREDASARCLRRGLWHRRIHLLPLTTVAALRGGPGAFEADLRRGQGSEDRGAAGPGDREEAFTVTADAVVLATGSGLYDPRRDPQDLARFMVSPDVVTALELEGLMRQCGGPRGTLRRPSDGRPVRRAAWLQCVGSRDPRSGRDHCSSACCMFALKEAVAVRRMGGEGTETAIFCMDLRAFGKGHQRYLRRAREERGVRLVRCRVHDVALAGDGSLRVRRLDQASGRVQSERFDLVVLSTGQGAVPAGQGPEACPGPPGSFPQPGGAPSWEGPGIFRCGTLASGLSDIASAVVSGSAAAGQVSRLLAGLGRTPEVEPDLAPERDVAREAPRVAVVLCRCAAGQVPRGLDLERLQQGLQGLAGVARVSLLDLPCLGDGPGELLDLLRGTGANRALLGACPSTARQRALQDAARRAGFNPNLVHTVDLYEDAPTPAGEQPPPDRLHARLQRRLAVGLAALLRCDPLAAVQIPVERRALVLGGGVAGLQAALSLAERGVDVHLVERTSELGGRAARGLLRAQTPEGTDPGSLAADLVARALAHPQITIHTGAEVRECRGSLGSFHSVIRDGQGQERMVLHGATVVATGAVEAATGLYGRGLTPRVLLQSELQAALARGRLAPEGSDPPRVVMIQCAGSRQPGVRDYCSRVCCAGAIKSALELLDIHPGARITILHRDIVTPGEQERHYSAARRRGVIFSRYSPHLPPRVQVEGDSLRITCLDPVLDRMVELWPDFLVLNTGMEPPGPTAELAAALGLELDPDGFFAEANPKWLPLDLRRRGFFVAGTARGPAPVQEALAQAEAAAQRAFAFLSRAGVQAPRELSRVRHTLCARCLRCVEVCPHAARSLDPAEQRIVVDPSACLACGICCAACPGGAAELPGVAGGPRVMAAIEASLEETW